MNPSILAPLSLPQTAHAPGALEQLPAWVGELAASPGTLVLVTGRGTLERLPQLRTKLEQLTDSGWQTLHAVAAGEPSAEWVDQQRPRLTNPGAQIVLAVGGGSALDAAKALAAMACESGPTRTYLEGVGDRPPSGARLPWIAIPTTMGTGSEATHNAVLGQPALQGGYKKSLRHPHFIADRIILDAELTASLPRSIIVSAGMDAFSQLLESYLAPSSSALLDRWLLYGLELAGRALPTLLQAANDPTALQRARHDMALAATLSGIGLTATGLGTVHGLIGPLGALAAIPHGVACANVLAPAMRLTLEEARTLGGDAQAWVESRMGHVAATLDGDASPARSPGDSAEALVETLTSWRRAAREGGDLAGLAEYGIDESHLDAVLKQASNRRNPVALSATQWRAVLDQAR